VQVGADEEGEGAEVNEKERRCGAVDEILNKPYDPPLLLVFARFEPDVFDRFVGEADHYAEEVGIDVGPDFEPDQVDGLEVQEMEVARCDAVVLKGIPVGNKAKEAHQTTKGIRQDVILAVVEVGHHGEEQKQLHFNREQRRPSHAPLQVFLEIRNEIIHK